MRCEQQYNSRNVQQGGRCSTVVSSFEQVDGKKGGANFVASVRNVVQHSVEDEPPALRAVAVELGKGKNTPSRHTALGLVAAVLACTMSSSGANRVFCHGLLALISSLFGLPVHETPRVLFHGVILACIIAAFWLMDALKDPILAATLGIDQLPKAKLLSVAMILVVVCLYDFLTSVVSKPTLFYIVSSLFGCIVALLAIVSSEAASEGGYFSHSAFGWISFFTIEAYGSLMTTLFWSFTNCAMDLSEARGAFGLIISVAQFGAVLGSTLATRAVAVGISGLFAIAAVLVFSVSILIQIYHFTYHDYLVRSSSFGDGADPDQPVPHIEHRTKSRSVGSAPIWSGFFEGLYLIARHSYLLKVLGVACLYEIVVTILDYEFKILASQHSLHGHGMDHEAEDRFTNFLGHFGQLTNFFSLVLSIFGFPFFVRFVGIDKTLLIFPCVLFLSVVVVHSWPSLRILFVLVSLLKGISCSLNDPAKELLYMPTSEAVKFKAKAWIDVFGSRSAKAMGSFVTSLAAGNLSALRHIGQGPVLLLSAGIILLAWSTGKDFMHLVSTGEIVGESGEQEHEQKISSALLGDVFHSNESDDDDEPSPSHALLEMGTRKSENRRSARKDIQSSSMR